MAGLIIGIDVTARFAPQVAAGPNGASTRSASVSAIAAAPAQRLRLFVQRRPGIYGAHGYVLQRGDSVPAADSVQLPGPPLVLTRGVPAEITVVNRLDAPTGVHWHGIELDSYYDGVGGWSGAGTRLAPRVAPNDSFVVRFAPPRAGTFMYHSHAEEVRQISLGLYGAIVVLEPGQAWEPRTDHLVIVGEAMVGGAPYVGVNGATARYPMQLAAGQTHRLRFINILVDNDANVSLLDDAGPVTWRRIAKDGADLPDDARLTGPARVHLGPGETFDVEVAPTPGRYRLQVLSYTNVLIDVRVPRP
jgi:FtsP/CotA-like multicopper oxidase with cupredoxin domain